MENLRWVSFALVTLLACGDSAAPFTEPLPDASSDALVDAPDASVDARDASLEDTAGSLSPCVAKPQRRTVTTDDGVALVYDIYLASEPGPVAILFHMVPPFDRADWPIAFIEALRARGISVLNIDRRGAGESGGDPNDGHFGEGGVLDARAAYDAIRDEPCVDASRFVMIGASAGTATALSYAVDASKTDRYPTPNGMIFLTAGSYTEVRVRMDDHRATLDAIPMTFVYTRFELDAQRWLMPLQVDPPETWTFLDSTPGGHGTVVFERAPESIVELADEALVMLSAR